MNRLINADALKETINAHDYVLKDCLNTTDKGMFTVGIMQAIDEQPTVDAVPLDGSFLKMSKGSYVIYQREWLYEHLEQEFDILRSASGKPTIDAEPVKRGMWTFIRLTDKDLGHKAKECSSCGSTFFDTRQWNYCPNCGARMGEE